MTQQITFERLKLLYARAENDKEIVVYRGVEFLAGYLKYLIEYLEGQGAVDETVVNLEPQS